jgi:hypothetical protein
VGSRFRVFTFEKNAPIFFCFFCVKKKDVKCVRNSFIRVVALNGREERVYYYTHSAEERKSLL